MKQTVGKAKTKKVVVESDEDGEDDQPVDDDDKRDSEHTGKDGILHGMLQKLQKEFAQKQMVAQALTEGSEFGAFVSSCGELSKKGNMKDVLGGLDTTVLKEILHSNPYNKSGDRHLHHLCKWIAGFIFKEQYEDLEKHITMTNAIREMTVTLAGLLYVKSYTNTHQKFIAHHNFAKDVVEAIEANAAAPAPATGLRRFFG